LQPPETWEINGFNIRARRGNLCDLNHIVRCNKRAIGPCGDRVVPRPDGAATRWCGDPAGGHPARGDPAGGDPDA